MAQQLAAGDEGLIEKIHALPAELFNRVKDLTFAADPSEIIICEDHKPSSLLQVSSSTREQYAKQFYSQTKFTFKRVELLQKFLLNSIEYHDHIQHLYLQLSLHTGEVPPANGVVFSVLCDLPGPGGIQGPAWALRGLKRQFWKALDQELLEDEIDLGHLVEILYDEPVETYEQHLRALVPVSGHPQFARRGRGE